MIVCQQGHNNLATELINNRRVQLELRDKLQHTALHFAAEKGSLSIVELLLRHGAKSSAVNYEGNTPLFLACQTKREGSLSTIFSLMLNNPMSCFGKHSSTSRTVSPVNVSIPRECPQGTILLVKYAGTKVFVHTEQRRLWYVTKAGFVFEATLPSQEGERLVFCKYCCKSQTDMACHLHRLKKRPRGSDEDCRAC